MLKQTVYKGACDCKDFRFGRQCFENYIIRNLSWVEIFNGYALLHVLCYNEKHKQLSLEELAQTEQPYDDHLSSNIGPFAFV